MFECNSKKAFTTIELVLSLFITCVTAVAAINLTFKKDKIPHFNVSDKVNSYVCHEESSAEKGVDQLTFVPDTTKYPGSIGYCDFSIDNQPDIMTKEFFTISLIGGGAGADANKKGGGAGETKKVIYPSLLQPFSIYDSLPPGSPKPDTLTPMCAVANAAHECTACIIGYSLNEDTKTCYKSFFYRAIIGKGGDKGKNGGTSSIHIVYTDSSNVQIDTHVMESALGGTATSEDCPVPVNPEDPVNQDCLGQKSTDGSTVKLSNNTEYEAGSGGDSDNTGHPGEVKISW